MLHKLRICVLTLGAAAVVCSPATSQAGCLDWLFGCRSCNYCDPCGGQTTYRPIFPRLSFFGSNCNSCYSPCSSCSSSCYSPCATSCYSPCATSCCTQYERQVSYRASCESVPVTTCQPVSACDPCTGCPTTVMRPVTTYVQRMRYTPVVTYRPVCPTTCASPCTSCGTTCGSTCGSSCGSCGSCGTTTFSGGTSGSCCSGGTPTTIPSALPATNVDSTFKQETGAYSPRFNDQQRNVNTNYRGQQASPPPPARPELTTEAPQRSWTFRRVSAAAPAASVERTPVERKPVETKPAAEDGGWRVRKR